MSVQERISLVEGLKAEVKGHCMCAKFEDRGDMYRVIYPPGYQFDAIQSHTSMGKATALTRLLESMERHWKKSFPGGDGAD